MGHPRSILHFCAFLVVKLVWKKAELRTTTIYAIKGRAYKYTKVINYGSLSKNIERHATQVEVVTQNVFKRAKSVALW